MAQGPSGDEDSSEPGPTGFTATHPAMRLRRPTVEDGEAIYRLVHDAGTLEPNSLYAYMLVATHFASTSVVAEGDDDRLAGFVAAYRVPDRPESVFVWQVATAAHARRRGLGLEMLKDVARGHASAGGRYLEATVAPGNEASRALFHGLARAMECACNEEPFLERRHFGDHDHDEEPLYRIGPLRA